MTARQELISAIITKLETDSAYRTSLNAAPKTITAATGTTTITITAAGHGLAIGDYGVITGVVGMTVLNTTHKVASVTTNTFTVVLPAATAQTYTSGGTVRRLANFYYQAKQGIAFPYNVFQFIADSYSYTSKTKEEEEYVQFALYDKRDSTYIHTLESGLIDLFDGAVLTFTNYTNIFLERRSKRSSKDEDGIWQTIIDYRIIMNHN
jgi:uncharacterized ion transporter superfamily protein YfcC